MNLSSTNNITSHNMNCNVYELTENVYVVPKEGKKIKVKWKSNCLKQRKLVDSQKKILKNFLNMKREGKLKKRDENENLIIP